MADQTAPESPVADDPGSRGSLVVHDRVAERLAGRAALNTVGVQPHSGGLDRLTGRDLPKVRVQISGDRIRAGLDVAVAWPSSLPQVTATVQRNVADALMTFAGMHVDGVDVSVLSVVADVVGQRPERRVR